MQLFVVYVVMNWFVTWFITAAIATNVDDIVFIYVDTWK